LVGSISGTDQPAVAAVGMVEAEAVTRRGAPSPCTAQFASVGLVPSSCQSAALRASGWAEVGSPETSSSQTD